MSEKVVIRGVPSEYYTAAFTKLLASRKPCPVCGLIPEINKSIFGAWFNIGCCGKFYQSNHDDYYGVIARWNKYVDKTNQAKPEEAKNVD